MATSTGYMTFTVVMMVTAAERRYIVIRSPATVFDIGGFIVSRPNAYAVGVSVSATS